MHFMKYCSICLIVLEFPSLVKVQESFSLLGSSNYAFLGKDFTWTCRTLKPQEIQTNYVSFKRNGTVCVGIGYTNRPCRIDRYIDRYTYGCLMEGVYTLTIPAENMTEDEQDSEWHCVLFSNSSYRSPTRKLQIAIDVNNISISPNDNPFTIREGSQQMFDCVVNTNAVPAPTIAWYLGSSNITTTALTYATSTTITGDRQNNNKTLECRATNNNSTKTAGTTLNVEYPPTVHTLSQQRVIEGRNLSITCQATNGNPSSTTFYWTRVPNAGLRQNGSTLHLSNIQRNSSGTYRCTANNNYRNGETGEHSQSFDIIVLYPPKVKVQYSQQNTEEGKNISANCSVTPGYPVLTTVFWTMDANPTFRQNGSILQFTNIKRNNSGTYRCTAENNFDNKESGSDSQTMTVNVQYPPSVFALPQQNIIEGGNISVECKAKTGNPAPTAFFWTKVNIMSFWQNRTTLSLPYIRRNSSGTYKCIAENVYIDGEKRHHSQTMVINVLYPPTIEMKPLTYVNESESVTLTRVIYSNPLSNVTWYRNGEVLQNEPMASEKITSYTIKKAKCSDTQNFTILASNEVEKNVTALVELRVNCKPRSYKTNFTLGVTDTTGIDFSTFVIAYPEPSIKLEYENGTESDQIMKSINRNAVNNFTIHINQAVVNQSDFGVYHLKVCNLFGELTMIVNVIAQRKPNVPVNIEIVCDETRAKVQWKSSFNGGDPQLFTIIASSGQQSKNISDKGENVIHSTFVQDLQPSTMYVFYVSARNSHGFISSEKISCTTLAESSDKLPIIVGSAAAGGITLIVILVVVVFLFRIYTNTEKQPGKSQRFENDLAENESVDDDGLKDNILYVSADPRENDKHEATVYAAVNKKDPMSNNNSNVYAEVKKNGIKSVKEGAIYSDVKTKKGFFKKDGKVKKEKRQKRKQEVADVYENSDDIAMTANPDNVYSNTNHNNHSAKEQRGYKNKDGLLYVEVQFDTKTEDKNPVIHGDDEKTDYATVEFPVPSSSHDRE